MTYFCADDEASRPIIAAGLSEGSVEFWRIDGDGREWYRTLPAIRGVPAPEHFDLAAELDDDTDDEPGVLFDGDLFAADAVPPIRSVDPNCGPITFDVSP